MRKAYEVTTFTASPQNLDHAATPSTRAGLLTGTVPDVSSLPSRSAPLTGLAAVVVVAGTLTACGSGDSTVAKTPQAGPPVTPGRSPLPRHQADIGRRRHAGGPVRDQPRVAHHRQVVSDLPRDPRSQQPWNPSPWPAITTSVPSSRGHHQGQHQHRQPDHPRGAVPPRPVHPAGVARHLRVQRH